MRCPKCGADIAEGLLYCEKCGEEINIVPEYDPLLEVRIGEDLEDEEEKKKAMEEAPEEEVLPEQDPQSHEKKLYLMRGILLAMALLILGLIIITQMDYRRTNSFEYQLEQAEKSRSVGEYDKAIKYYTRALELNADNVELLEKLATVYFLKNDQAWYEATLIRILSNKSATVVQIRETKEKLIPIYVKKGDFDAIAELIETSNDPVLMASYQKYLSPKPVLSLEEGTYAEMKSVQIYVEEEKAGKIYYTLDGSVPSENGTLYTLPVVLEKGRTTLRACFINEYGVKSEIATATYVIDENAKDTPE